MASRECFAGVSRWVGTSEGRANSAPSQGRNLPSAISRSQQQSEDTDVAPDAGEPISPQALTSLSQQSCDGSMELEGISPGPRRHSRSARHVHSWGSMDRSLSLRSDSSTSPTRRSSLSSSFKRDNLPAGVPRRARRECARIDADSLASNRSGDITPVSIEKFLVDERQRLAKRITSQAYENDAVGALLEKRLTSPRRPQKRKGSSSKQHEVESTFHSVAPAAGMPTVMMDQTGAANSEEVPDDMLKFLGWVDPIKWLTTFVIGVCVASWAATIIMFAHLVSAWKVQVIGYLSSTFGDLGQLYIFLFLLAYGLPCCLLTACLVTYWAPHSGGSGIPEIKAYLNGINMPQAFTFSCWFCRSLGLFLVSTSGMFAGSEGPFAHLGGIMGSGFADGPPGFWARGWWPRVLHGHRNRCEFIAQGGAMGVAAAFGAPVGGILFSLEDTSSHWSRLLTWRSFFGTMVAAVLAKFCKSGFKSISGSGFVEFPDADAGFENWELGAFALLGLFFGLLQGALFCNAVRLSLSFRRRFFQLGCMTPLTRRLRLLEVAGVVVLTACVCLWPAVLAGCTSLPGEGAPATGHRRLISGDTGPPDISGGMCPPGQYSTMGYILLSPKEETIKTMFSYSMSDGAQMNVGGLLGAFALAWCTTIVTFGSAMPVGLFIPNILAGACLGRAVGQQLLHLGLDVHPGVYALMGAAGALAGFSRVTLSLVVIFSEITNNLNFVLPLMLVIMISKQVADQFGPSVYHLVLYSNPEVHLLEDWISEDHLLVLEGLSVHDMATSEVVVLRSFEPLEKIMQLLVQTSFSAYPVVDREGRLLGIVSRTKLVALMDEKQHLVQGGELIPVVTIAETAEVTLWDAPVVRAFRHFRAAGLSHLCVVDVSMSLLGVLTRTDFAKLCRFGPEGVQQVREVMQRKQAAAAAGLLQKISSPGLEDWAHAMEKAYCFPSAHSSGAAAESSTGSGASVLEVHRDELSSGGSTTPVKTMYGNAR